MPVNLTIEELTILNGLLPAIPLHDEFTITDAYDKKEEMQGRPDAWRIIKPNVDHTQLYLRLSMFLIEQGFAKSNSSSGTAINMYLTFEGKVLCAFGNLQTYYNAESSTIDVEQKIKEVPRIMAMASPYGEFAIVWQKPLHSRVVTANPTTLDGEKTLQKLIESLDPKKQILDEFWGVKLNEEVIQYLIWEGFIINRHDIKTDNIVYRQLTDSGRTLKSLGSIEAYKIHQAQESDLADRRKKRDANLYSINFWIAVGTVVVAIYTLFQMFDYYEHRSLDWQMFSYFLTGLGVGLLIWLIVSQLLKLKHKR